MATLGAAIRRAVGGMNPQQRALAGMSALGGFADIARQRYYAAERARAEQRRERRFQDYLREQLEERKRRRAREFAALLSAEQLTLPTSEIFDIARKKGYGEATPYIASELYRRRRFQRQWQTMAQEEMQREGQSNALEDIAGITATDPSRRLTELLNLRTTKLKDKKTPGIQKQAYQNVLSSQINDIRQQQAAARETKLTEFRDLLVESKERALSAEEQKRLNRLRLELPSAQTQVIENDIAEYMGAKAEKPFLMRLKNLVAKQGKNLSKIKEEGRKLILQEAERIKKRHPVNAYKTKSQADAAALREAAEKFSGIWRDPDLRPLAVSLFKEDVLPTINKIFESPSMPRTGRTITNLDRGLVEAYGYSSERPIPGMLTSSVMQREGHKYSPELMRDLWTYAAEAEYPATGGRIGFPERFGTTEQLTRAMQQTAPGIQKKILERHPEIMKPEIKRSIATAFKYFDPAAPFRKEKPSFFVEQPFTEEVGYHPSREATQAALQRYLEEQPKAARSEAFRYLLEHGAE